MTTYMVRFQARYQLLAIVNRQGHGCFIHGICLLQIYSQVTSDFKTSTSFPAPVGQHEIAGEAVMAVVSSMVT